MSNKIAKKLPSPSLALRHLNFNSNETFNCGPSRSQKQLKTSQDLKHNSKKKPSSEKKPKIEPSVTTLQNQIGNARRRDRRLRQKLPYPA